MKTCWIKDTADVGGVRRAVVEKARAMGFDDLAQKELAIVVTELATNLAVHHTIEGRIDVSEVSDNLGLGIEIVARDRGPGIPDVKQALEDHHSRGGSMGCGLGAVRRLMDEFDIHSSPASEVSSQDDLGGTIITTRKWLADGREGRHFISSGQSRPCRGETANGDGFFVAEERDGLFVAVADGLGHGRGAEEASQKAIECVRQHRDKDFKWILAETHKALFKTRGAALTLVRVRLSDRKLIHAGVGNVQARVYPQVTVNLIPRDGVLGFGASPRPRINQAPWPQNGILVVFTDGLSGRWDLSETPQWLDQPLTILSHRLIQTHGRVNDDATVVVAKETAS